MFGVEHQRQPTTLSHSSTFNSSLLVHDLRSHPLNSLLLHIMIFVHILPSWYMKTSQLSINLPHLPRSSARKLNSHSHSCPSVFPFSLASSTHKVPFLYIRYNTPATCKWCIVAVSSWAHAATCIAPHSSRPKANSGAFLQCPRHLPRHRRLSVPLTGCQRDQRQQMWDEDSILVGTTLPLNNLENSASLQLALARPNRVCRPNTRVRARMEKYMM